MNAGTRLRLPLGRAATMTPVLLVTATGTRWWPHAPRSPHQAVAVVADLIEETLQPITVPALFGRDRAAYLRTQLSTKVGASGWTACWSEAAGLLPRATHATLVGLDSPTLAQAIQALLEEKRPIVGLWTLNALLLRAQARGEPSPEPQLWILPTEHGCRLLLRQGKQPLFTRLLPVHTAQDLEQELSATVRYIRDNAVVARDLPLTLRWLGDDAPPWNADAIGVGVRIMHTPGEGAWPSVLRYARAGTPLQMANPVQRRYFLAQLGLLALHAVGAMGIGGAAWFAGEAWLALDRQREANRLQADRLQAMQQKRETLSQNLQDQGVNLVPLKMALQIPHLRPDLARPPTITETAWQTVQWLPSLSSQAQLTQWSWQLEAGCENGSPSASGGSAPPNADAVAVSTSAPPKLRLDLSFALDPTASAAAQARWVHNADALLHRQASWQVVQSPVAARSQQALRLGGQGERAEASAAAWCLQWNAPAKPTATAGVADAASSRSPS